MRDAVRQWPSAGLARVEARLDGWPLARRLLPVLGIAGAVFLVSAALSPSTMKGFYDAKIMFQVAHSMVTYGDVRVREDGFQISVPYSSYGIGMSLFMALGELLGRAIGRPAQSIDTLINPVLLALLAAAVWGTARRLGASTRQAGVVALAVAGLTPLLPDAATNFSEVGTALGVAVAIGGVVLARDRSLLGGVVTGAGIGFAGLLRPDSFVLVAPVVAVGAVIAFRKRWSGIAGLAAGVAPAVIVTGWYNDVRFGSPLTVQYQGLPLRDSFPFPFWRGLLGLVASPGRGIVFYAPLILVLVVAVRWAWARSPLVAAVCLALILDRFLFFSAWYGWHGGTTWGPRYLVPAMPALAPFLLEVVRRLRGPRTAARVAGVTAMAVLAVASLGVELIGTLTDPHQSRIQAAIQDESAHFTYASPIDRFAAPEVIAAWSDAMFQWSLFPIADDGGQLLRGENVDSRYLSPDVKVGRLVPVGVVVAALLALGLRRRREDASVPNESLVPD